MPAISRHEVFDNTQTQSERLRGIEPEPQGTSSTADAGTLNRAANAEFLAERQAIVLTSISALLKPSSFDDALDAFILALREHFDVKRISLALINDSGALELSAQSELTASFEGKKLLLTAMKECLEQESIVCFPDAKSELESLPAHNELNLHCDEVNLITVPLYHDLEAVGALLIEQRNGKSLSLEMIELLQHIAVVSAPTLSIRRNAARGAFGHFCNQLHTLLAARFGTKGFGIAIIVLFTSIVILLTTVVPFSRNVTANAELVPQERRLITAPFDGFIEALAVEAGESVVAGQLLGQLEKKELELEGARRDGDIASAEAEFRSAMANHDWQATAVARARLDRERALRALVDQRLERIELRAPIAGLVVSTNTADAVGAPVRRGETLFEIAQPEDYEVHLMVHERDIREVQVGQKGTLSLRARPGENLDMLVHTIHPVAEKIDGVSRFRVVATLEIPAGITPRPGESGTAKLNAGTTNFLHLWGQPFSQHLTELWWRFSQ